MCGAGGSREDQCHLTQQRTLTYGAILAMHRLYRLALGVHLLSSQVRQQSEAVDCIGQRCWPRVFALKTATLCCPCWFQVAEWNGYSRCLLPNTAGVQVVSTRSRWDWSLQAGLMARAHMLGLPPKVFARQPEVSAQGLSPCNLICSSVVEYL